MGNLTEELPKPLLTVGEKTLLEYKLEALPPEITEVIIVVGFFGEKIRRQLGEQYLHLPITYIEQETCNGTMGALLAAKPLLSGTFLVMMGDDIYAEEDMALMVRERAAVCAKEIRSEERGGELLLDADDNFVGMYEARHFIEKGLINSGLYTLPADFLDEEPVLVPGTTEFGIPHTLVAYAKRHPVHVVTSNAPWLQITREEDLIEAAGYLGVV